MPNIKSAKKRVRTIAKSNVLNNDAKASMRTAIKKVEKAVAANEKKETVNELVSVAFKKIDKTLKAKIIKTNTAARYKSRLGKMLNNIK